MSFIVLLYFVVAVLVTIAVLWGLVIVLGIRSELRNISSLLERMAPPEVRHTTGPLPLPGTKGWKPPPRA